MKNYFHTCLRILLIQARPIVSILEIIFQNNYEYPQILYL